MRAWAALIQQRPPEPPTRSMGEAFFAEHVMPTLIRRGCSMEGCHSPNGFNDFRLRPGALGFVHCPQHGRLADPALAQGQQELHAADIVVGGRLLRHLSLLADSTAFSSEVEGRCGSHGLCGSRPRL